MVRKKSRSPSTQQKPGVKKGQGHAGPPRFDPYHKLLSRLYEHLNVLYEYDSVRGDHTSDARQSGLGGWLDDLAFLCEYKKGGDACTAIGLEDSEECYVFWVAANVDPSRKITPFLEKLLKPFPEMLHMSAEDKAQREQRLLHMCVDHAWLKIKDLRSLLLRAISQCLDRVDHPVLTDWHEQFTNSTDHVACCRLAYGLRHTDGLKEITSMETYKRSPAERKSPFHRVEHYIGRLSHYVRATQRLIKELPLVKDLITNPYLVKCIPLPRCVNLPQPDNLTTLDGICTRMLPKDDPMWSPLKAELGSRSIVEKLLVRHQNPKTPRVHAEIQVLDFFHGQGLKWAENSKYVGCSKPACFLCQRYFRHHPARPNEPASHQKVWLSWGPVLLELGTDDPSYIQQRNILNKIIQDIRDELFDQMRSGRGPHTWHEDTRTDITRSLNGAEDRSVSELTFVLDSVYIGSSSDQGLSQKYFNVTSANYTQMLQLPVKPRLPFPDKAFSTTILSQKAREMPTYMIQIPVQTAIPFQVEALCCRKMVIILHSSGLGFAKFPCLYTSIICHHKYQYLICGLSYYLYVNNDSYEYRYLGIASPLAQ